MMEITHGLKSFLQGINRSKKLEHSQTQYDSPSQGRPLGKFELQVCPRRFHHFEDTNIANFQMIC